MLDQLHLLLDQVKGLLSACCGDSAGCDMRHQCLKETDVEYLQRVQEYFQPSLYFK
jgi:hypothetical protein